MCDKRVLVKLTLLFCVVGILNALSYREQTLARGGNTPWYSLDDVSLLHYGTQKRDSTGHRAYLELNFAIQTDDKVGFHLTEKEDYWSGIRYTVYVGGRNNQRTYLWYNGTIVQEIATPKIFSPTQFQSFYLKIDDGKLQFGKEGDAPLISYSGFDLGPLNFYLFETFGGPTKIRFHPAAVEALPCKETLGSCNPPWYSLDDVSLHHYGTQKGDSTGHRAYLGLNFAIQTDDKVGFHLTEKEDYWSGIRYTLYVGGHNNQRTYLWYNGTIVQDIATPKIFSPTQFLKFYLKIDDGILQFGKEGDAPLISYSGFDLGPLNFYRFETYGGPAKFRFCPAAVEGSS